MVLGFDVIRTLGKLEATQARPSGDSHGYIEISFTYEYIEENNGIKSTRPCYILMRAGGLLWRDDLGFLSYFFISLYMLKSPHIFFC